MAFENTLLTINGNLKKSKLNELSIDVKSHFLTGTILKGVNNYLNDIIIFNKKQTI